MSSSRARVPGSGGAGEQKSKGARPNAPAPLLTASPARRRQALYRLFGALFLYPDAERLAHLRAVAAELNQATELPDEAPFAEPLQRLLHILAALPEGANIPVEEEYVRLFLAKPAAPPYESTYVDPQRQATGWIAVKLEREYGEAGLALAPSLAEPSDHVAVELEYMAYLCSQEAEVRESHATEDGLQQRQRQQTFLERHLGRWFPYFARRVRAATPDHLYDPLIEAVEGFIRFDLDCREVT